MNIVKNADHSFLDPKVVPSNVFFCPTNNPKPKDIQFTKM